MGMGTRQDQLVAALSRRLRIENMKMADRMVSPTSSMKNCQSSHLSQKGPMNPAIRFPIAVAPNQPPCACPLYCGGATLETKEMPIGLRNNSAMVSVK